MSSAGFCVMIWYCLIEKQGLLSKIRAYVQYNAKRTKKSSKRAQFWIFTTHFLKFRAFITLNPLKQYVFLEFLVENKAFNSKKRACPEKVKVGIHLRIFS